MEHWTTFFSAELGAAATLAGLLFVSASINLSRIIQFANLPRRAMEALLAFLVVLIVATFGLTPGQSMQTFGLEVECTGLALWLVQTRSLVVSFSEDRKYQWMPWRVLSNQVHTFLFVITGVLCWLGWPAGIYWLVPATLVSFGVGLIGAWVLLIEIQR